MKSTRTAKPEPTRDAPKEQPPLNASSKLQGIRGITVKVRETSGTGFVIGGQAQFTTSLSGGPLVPAAEKTLVRNQREARRVVDSAYPFRCCAVCGLQAETCLQTCHLDHNAANNTADNLAHLCPTHHWMYDAGLYPIEAIKLLQAHWQTTQGMPDHKGRMKDAGAKAALTRKRRAAARKAVATRRDEKLAKHPPPRPTHSPG